VTGPSVCDDDAMERSRTDRRVRLSARVHTSTLHLPALVLLTGAALALAFAALDVLVSSVVLALPRPWSPLLLGVVIVAAPTLAGFVPQLRHLEGTAAVSLLRVDLGGPPVVSVTWSQRIRTAAWLWLHLLSGAVVIVAIYGIALGGMLVTKPLLAPPGQRILGQPGLEITGTGRDVWLAVLGLALVVAMVTIVVVCGAGLTRLAAPLLGPTPDERIAALAAQASVLGERTRIARELHDSVGHALSVVVLQAAAARRRMARGDEAEADRSLMAVEETARTALAELDDVLGLLRDEETDSRRHPSTDLTAVPELVRAVRAAGHDVSATGLDEVAGRVPGVVSREAYRIVQEGLTNALRHAPGLPVSVEFTAPDGRLHIEVTNPVPRAPTRPWRTRQGRGLTGIAERAGVLGGSMCTAVVDDQWRLSVLLPLPHEVTR
jgi:signal transduction histidine kinase